MIARWIIVGFLLWLAITAGFYFGGPYFFVGGQQTLIWAFLLAPIVMFILTWGLLKVMGVEVASMGIIEPEYPEDEVVQFSVDQTLRPLTYPARLWSQIERLHAGLAVGGWDEALKAAAVIRRFLDVPTPGLWRDRLSPDGTFVDEPAPSSTLYHLISAARALDAVCGGRARRLSGNLGP